MSAYSPMTDFLPTLSWRPQSWPIRDLGSQLLTNKRPDICPSSPVSLQTHHNFIVNNYLFLQIVITPNPCAGLKDFCESLSGIWRRIENIQPQSISISSMNEQWTNTPHIRYSYLELSAHKYPDIENNNLPTWPGVMFCLIGKCESCHNGRNVPAAYWPRLPSDQSKLGPKHSLCHTFTDNFRGIYDCIVSPACVRWLQNTKHSWCHLLMASSGQQHIMGPGTSCNQIVSTPHLVQVNCG